MKTKLPFLFALLFIVACSDDDPSPRKADIWITINASDTERPSEIETLVYGMNLELRTYSSSNNHLPYRLPYLEQTIPELGAINITFRDHSPVPIGAVFEPYTLEIIIEIDDETAISKQYSVDEQGYMASVDLSLTEYFSNR